MIKKNFWCGVILWHNFNINLLTCDMNIQIRKIQDKSSYWHKNNNTSSILIKAIMSSQNSMAKEISSLQNHIVRLCFIFVTQECSHHAQPRWQAKQLFHTYDILKTFSIFTQHMSVSHGYSTICGIEWWLWRRQKRRKSHIDEDNQRAMEILINWCQHEE